MQVYLKLSLEDRVTSKKAVEFVVPAKQMIYEGY